MDVSNRRPAEPEVKIDTLEANAEGYRKALERIDAIEDELKGELWKMIKERGTAIVKSVDDQEYQYAKGGKLSTSLDCLLGQKAAAIDFLAIEEFVKSRKLIEARLVEVEDKIAKLSKSSIRNR